MIRDFRLYDGEEDIHCDICVAGAGAAGIAIALDLADRGHGVVLLEAGSLDYQEETQDPYVGDIVGQPYHDLATTRLRFLGGSTNHWGGMCTHLEPYDFEKRPWIPYSGWPIGFEDLRPWYELAHPWVELGNFDYRRDAIVPKDTRFLPVDNRRLTHKMWHFSQPPTNFGVEYRTKLEATPSLDVFLNANLVDIKLDPLSEQVQEFVIRSYQGKQTIVRARHYVLAMGGLENPKLLLSAKSERPQGLGNERDLVGRFFMEHLNTDAGQVATSDNQWAASYAALFRNNRQYRAYLVASQQQQAQRQILGSAVSLGQLFFARERSVAFESLHKIRMAWRRGRFPDDLGAHIVNIIKDASGLKESIEERFDPTIYLYTEGEQAPNPSSRVVLSDEHDALGLPRIRLDWRLSEIDKRSIRETALLIGQELGRMNKGRVGLPSWLLEERIADDDPLIGAYHHMGTTRMGSDASIGVVDANCRVFTTKNLFIAGSSVFATGGAANPTLTIVALALRLADHLDHTLARRPNITTTSAQAD